MEFVQLVSYCANKCLTDSSTLCSSVAEHLNALSVGFSPVSSSNHWNMQFFYIMLYICSVNQMKKPISFVLNNLFGRLWNLWIWFSGFMPLGCLLLIVLSSPEVVIWHPQEVQRMSLLLVFCFLVWLHLKILHLCLILHGATFLMDARTTVCQKLILKPHWLACRRVEGFICWYILMHWRSCVSPCLN